MRKLGIAFLDNETSHSMNTKNVKWQRFLTKKKENNFITFLKRLKKRDQKYFENYHLDLEFQQDMQKKIETQYEIDEGNHEHTKTDYEESESDDETNAKSYENEDIDYFKKSKKQVKKMFLTT